jgi:transcriptional antiterminator NusG
MWSWGSDAADRDGIGDQEELMEELESKEHAEQTPDADKAGSVEETVKSAADSARDVPGVDAMPASEAEKAPVLGEEAAEATSKGGSITTEDARPVAEAAETQVGASPISATEQAGGEVAPAAEAAPELEAGSSEEPVPAVEASEVNEPDQAPSEAAPAAPSGTATAGETTAEGGAAAEASGEAAWYVIHCYSGYENKVHNLEQRIETMGMKDKIFDVVIPTQEEIEVRDGKRRTVERHIFPGYVLVNMALSEESWYVVRNTPGVTGFVGMGNLPTPLRPEEVAQIIKRMEAEAPTVKVSFKLGERVRIIDGPFNDFRGTVAAIDMERTKVRVMVSFFGRETPVELDFLQVEKA